MVNEVGWKMRTKSVREQKISQGVAIESIKGNTEQSREQWRSFTVIQYPTIAGLKVIECEDAKKVIRGATEAYVEKKTKSKKKKKRRKKTNHSFERAVEMFRRGMSLIKGLIGLSTLRTRLRAGSGIQK